MGSGNVWSFVIAAYVVTWIGLAGYSARLILLTRGAKDTVEELRGEG